MFPTRRCAADALLDLTLQSARHRTPRRWLCPETLDFPLDIFLIMFSLYIAHVLPRPGWLYLSVPEAACISGRLWTLPVLTYAGFPWLVLGPATGSWA